MQVIKTVKIPVHHATTKRKLSILKRLTARLTYGVTLWSELIKTNNIRTRKQLRSRIFEQEVKEQTRLSAGFVQCCGDTALWMWKSYREQHKAWIREVKFAERRGKERWIKKLLKREPQKPLSNGVKRKIPIWFDYRIGKLEKAKNINMASYVIRVATLKRGEWVTVPLDPAQYHVELVEQRAVKSFQIVKKGPKYYVHVKVEYEVPDKPFTGVLGVDLGVKRSAATVLLNGERLTPKSFLTIHDGKKKNRLDQLNRLVSRLQQAKKYEALKPLRHKRKYVTEYFDRLFAKKLTALSEGCLLVVGYPKDIKYNNFKGNGKRRLRRLLTRWSYNRIIRFIMEERAEKGLSTIVVDERWSSKTCWKCGSRKTERINQSTLRCWNCCKYFNADYNAALNIGLHFLAKATGRGATAELAQTGDEQAEEACNLGSQHASAVGSSLVFKRGDEATCVAKDEAMRILRILRSNFSLPQWVSSNKDPFQTLIITVLSQNTNDKNTARAFENLSRGFPITPEALAKANVDEIEDSIRVAGLYRNKSRVIKELSRVILERFKGSLDFIYDMPFEEARKNLLSIPGVGPKTADVVLLFCAERPTVPVDTHVNRVSKRLGFVPPDADYEGVRQGLQSLFPTEEYLPVHILLILLGRKYCKARKPLCEPCPVNRFCPRVW